MAMSQACVGETALYFFLTVLNKSDHMLGHTQQIQSIRNHRMLFSSHFWSRAC